MATKMCDLFADTLGSLRYEPTEKRLRVYLADELIADTGDGRLVWEPGRVVPTYAVPAADISGRLEPAESSRPLLLFETLLPVRFYLPRNDIAADLQPTDAVTYCAYKGQASYYSFPGARPISPGRTTSRCMTRSRSGTGSPSSTRGSTLSSTVSGATARSRRGRGDAAPTGPLQRAVPHFNQLRIAA
jgi:uncharacterized protein (DUF427 family)